MDRQSLAQLVLQKIQYGSVITAFYPAKVRTGGSEHQIQADQFAADHESFYILNGDIAVGKANKIDGIPVWDTLKSICEKGTALLKEFSLIDEAASLKVNDIAFLTHGTVDALEIGTVNGGFNDWVSTHSYADFIKKITPYLADTTKIIMYGCTVAGGPGTVDPFAEKFRKELLANLEGVYGGGNPTVEVWGHKDAGHTTANDRIVQFAGSGNYNGGDSLLDDFASWLCYDKMAAKGVVPENYTDTAKLKKLTDNSYDAMLKAFQAAGPNGEERDKSNKAYTAPDHPVNTLLREIPYLGIANLWNDIHATTPPDYSYLVITDAASQRLAAGVLLKRERFNTKNAALDSLFDQTL